MPGVSILAGFAAQPFADCGQFRRAAFVIEMLRLPFSLVKLNDDRITTWGVIVSMHTFKAVLCEPLFPAISVLVSLKSDLFPFDSAEGDLGVISMIELVRSH